MDGGGGGGGGRGDGRVFIVIVEGGGPGGGRGRGGGQEVECEGVEFGVGRLVQGGEGMKLWGVTRRLLGAFGVPVGPPQVKHPVAGGLEVEGGQRSPEAGGGEQVWWRGVRVCRGGGRWWWEVSEEGLGENLGATRRYRALCGNWWRPGGRLLGESRAGAP